MGSDAQLAAGKLLRGISGGNFSGDEVSETGNVQGKVRGASIRGYLEGNIPGGFSGKCPGAFNADTDTHTHTQTAFDQLYY